jgi:hypothetical protein
MVVVLAGRSLSARTVEEDADADAQRFVVEEIAEEFPVRIGASLGVWATSDVCGF